MATDPNVNNEYTGLSPLTMDDIRNFIDSYVKPYAPYREEKVYNTLMNTLTEYYYRQTYTTIPNELKQIFEDGNFQADSIYNQLLIAIGVPSTIIEKLTLENKILFLKTLADFERYKGTISFFKKVASTFNDRISIYELYIDYNGVNWILKPVPVYRNEELPLKDSSILYSMVYETIPSLLVSEDQLTSLYNDNQLVLPIKSNILLVDNDLTTSVSLLYDVIVAVFLHTYQDNYIDIFFNDGTTSVQLKTIYYLWYYLLTKRYGLSWKSLSPLGMIRFAYGRIGTSFPTNIGGMPTTIEGLQDIIDRYDDIETSIERDAFYKDIADAFNDPAATSSIEATEETLYNSLLVLDSTLAMYINNRISNTLTDEKSEIAKILSELYISLTVYVTTCNDTYFEKYSDYFLQYLPQILINPEDTTSYTILYNLKPYHVELYSKNSSGITCEDKFNQIFINDGSDGTPESGFTIIDLVAAASVINFPDYYIFDNLKYSETCMPIVEYYKILNAILITNNYETFDIDSTTNTLLIKYNDATSFYSNSFITITLTTGSVTANTLVSDINTAVGEIIASTYTDGDSHIRIKFKPPTGEAAYNLFIGESSTCLEILGLIGNDTDPTVS